MVWSSVPGSGFPHRRQHGLAGGEMATLGHLVCLGQDVPATTRDAFVCIAHTSHRTAHTAPHRAARTALSRP